MAEEVAVASVVYNMAGDEADRPSYLKSLVIQQQFGRYKSSISEAITSGLLNGPAMRLRSFFRWARDNGDFDLIGLPSGELERSTEADEPLLIAAIEEDNPTIVVDDITESATGAPSPLWWAARWILEELGEAWLSSEWSASIDSAGEFITIIVEGEVADVIAAVDPVYDSTAWYAYAMYEINPSGVGVWIYKEGGGHPEIDALVGAGLDMGSFFPHIPVRLNNNFLSPSFGPLTYAAASAAYKKATGGAKFDELVDIIADNEDIGDIDHAYIVFGVSLNVLENQCRKYLYQFFETLRGSQSGGASAYDDWVARGKTDTPLNSLKVRTSITGTAPFDFRIRWRFITEITGSGLGKVDAEVGDYWVQKAGTVDGYLNARIYWQETASSYRYLSLLGMEHRNYVYGSSAVVITTHQAIDDLEDSGFIVPLNYELWREMSLVSTSQMATACMFIVFNCFEVHVQQWYETFLFKILLVVVIAVVSVVLTGGVGTVGLLGSALSLGSALGFTGITAAIVGSVVNALAAMLLVSLLQPFLEQVAGPLAPVVMAVLMFAIGQAAGSLTQTGVLSINWADLLRVDNLLAMTSAVGQGVTNAINADTLALQQQALDIMQNAEAEALKIQQAFFDKFGYGAAAIDPLLFVDALKAPVAESSDTFLHRTLMTGSEIAEMSRELLYDFPTYSLKLPDAFT
jgi:hypothetical protein